MKRYRKDTLLKVFWIDAAEDPKWQSEEEAGKRPDNDAITVGFYLKHDKEFLYLSGTISNKERNKATIPLGCIKRTGRKYCIFEQEDKHETPHTTTHQKGN